MSEGDDQFVQALSEHMTGGATTAPAVLLAIQTAITTGTKTREAIGQLTEEQAEFWEKLGE